MCPREKPTSQDNRLATWSRCKYHHHIPQKPPLRRPSNGNSILTIQNQIKSKYQFLSDSMSLELQKVWKFKNTHIGTPQFKYVHQVTKSSLLCLGGVRAYCVHCVENLREPSCRENKLQGRVHVSWLGKRAGETPFTPF